ncbi:jg23594 [Pararge aegeria aegeria]|uniref:Jg23594 protein n=1 Tax=Pararge aegeria aegeria TaxID=348720 RepID=A0A8S4QXY7_9NEOP|nr:jg23594 [Pararge aegeria aegeria]
MALAGKKHDILNKVKRYFTTKQLLILYQAQVRSCMEYCSHLWDGSVKYQLDSVDRRARRPIVPPSPFYHRTARHRKDLHPYVVDIPRTRTKRFASSFLIRTARIWNALPASIFPSAYNMSTFKSRVNRHLLGKRAPP